jgi:hypothetical protein
VGDAALACVTQAAVMPVPCLPQSP